MMHLALFWTMETITTTDLILVKIEARGDRGRCNHSGSSY